jgi:hypothetical protein
LDFLIGISIPQGKQKGNRPMERSDDLVGLFSISPRNIESSPVFRTRLRPNEWPPADIAEFRRKIALAAH